MGKKVKKEEQELSDVGKLMVKNTLEDDQKKQEILKDLKKNPKYKKFFAPYNKQTVQMFIRAYADAKWRYLKYGEMYLKREDKETSRYKYRAEQCFWQIQQKKLFNVQCLWRAEKIQLPGILLSREFEYWEKAIKTCPYIEPVSEEEFNLYLEYLNSDSYSYGNDDEYCDWQGFMMFIDDDDFDEDYPAWYRFYDEKKGTGDLIKLPDLRGDKEMKYTKLAAADRMETYKKEHPEYTEHVSDPRPMITYGDEFLVEFIKKFDDPILLKYHELMDRGDYDDDEFPELSDALEDLKNAEVPIIVEEGSCWQDTIIKSMASHQIRQLNKALPIVYDEYLFRLHNNIAFGYTDEEIEDQDRERKMVDESFKTNILLGRKLNSEPEDFNF
jgi:hypothetical protein